MLHGHPRRGQHRAGTLGTPRGTRWMRAGQRPQCAGADRTQGREDLSPCNRAAHLERGVVGCRRRWLSGHLGWGSWRFLQTGNGRPRMVRFDEVVVAWRTQGRRRAFQLPYHFSNTMSYIQDLLAW